MAKSKKQLFKGCNYDCFKCKYDDCYQDKLSHEDRASIRKREEQFKENDGVIGNVGYISRSRRSLSSRLSIILLIPLLIFSSTLKSKAEEPELIKGFATAYCQSGITATGTKTREGICSSSRDRFGKTIVLYKRLPDGSIGDYIGTYECQDTGGTAGIKSGKVIDIWCNGLDACQDFMDLVYEDGCEGKVWIQIIDTEG